MKRRLFVAGSVVLLVLAGVVLFVGRRQSRVVINDPTPGIRSASRPAPATKPLYRLTVDLDPTTSRVSATQLVRVTNNADDVLNELYFHLFPNSPLFQLPNGQGPSGSVTVDSVTVNGEQVRHRVLDREILRVPLPHPVIHGDSVSLEMRWREQVPHVTGRFGVNLSTVYLGNFYPILAVKDQGGWHLDKYLLTGDPFYSEVADYDVTVQVPEGFIVAATGQPYPTHTQNGTATFRFGASSVRDFAAAASSTWTLHEAVVDGVNVHYYRDSLAMPGVDLLSPDQAMAVITGSLRFFNEKWGKYPYGDLSVVDHGGMEYPQFIMANASPAVIAHEVAHQWWYGVVGNDEVRQIWDEGLAEFSAMYYLASTGRPKDKPFGLDRGEAMDKSLYTYVIHSEAQAADYYATEYGRGWMLWEALRRTMGSASFEQMIREFYTNHKFAVATWDDWRDAVQRSGGEHAVQVFDSFVKAETPPADPPSGIRLDH